MSALVAVLPETWVPMRQRSRAPTLPSIGQSTEEHQDPHRPQLDELCIDIWMTESLTTSCGLSVSSQLMNSQVICRNGGEFSPNVARMYSVLDTFEQIAGLSAER